MKIITQDKIMQRQTIPPELSVSKKIHCASSYINAEGQHPPIGCCFITKNIVLDRPLKESQWQFCVKEEELRNQVVSLSYCDEIIIITHED